MPIYNNESKIFAELKDIDFRKCLLLGDSIHLSDVHSKIFDENWVLNAKNTNFPPDYYNDTISYMMEVMRIDDHAEIMNDGSISNTSREVNSKAYKHIKSLFEKSNLNIDSSNIFVNVNSGLPTHKDHTYDFYKNEFLRVIQNHINKISTYRDNHPNKHLIFTIFDESSQYFELSNSDNYGSIHYHFLDKSLMDIFIDSDVDYVFWMTPYKKYQKGTPRDVPDQPELTIIDVRNFDYSLLIEYDDMRMVSNEL